MEHYDYGPFSSDRAAKMKLLKLTSIMILENGAETYRADQLLTNLCIALGAPYSSSFALLTGILISISETGEKHDTFIIPIRKRTVNLGNIDRINNVARAICSNKISLEAAVRELESLTKTRENRLLMALAAGATSLFFALLLGAELRDGFIALLCGFLSRFALSYIKWNDFYNFLSSALGGAITAAITVFFVHFVGGQAEPIITGAIMQFVPGLAITNGIRDIIRGDLMSGGARLTESVFIALALAVGAGAVLSLYIGFGGII